MFTRSDEKEQLETEPQKVEESEVSSSDENTKVVDDVADIDDTEAAEPIISDEEMKVKEEKDTNGIQVVADYPNRYNQ